MTQFTYRTPGYAVSDIALLSSADDISEVLHSPELRKTALQVRRNSGWGYYRYSASCHRRRETDAALHWAKGRGVQVLRQYNVDAIDEAQQIVATGVSTVHRLWVPMLTRNTERYAGPEDEQAHLRDRWSHVRSRECHFPLG